MKMNCTIQNITENQGEEHKMEHILSLSYGKDSLACLGAIKELGLPLDRIVHCEVMATPTISGDLPEMQDFKAYADKIIEKKYGIKVEHIKVEKSFEEFFYTRYIKGKHKGKMYGFPYTNAAWCNTELKVSPVNKVVKNNIRYIGIACDEPKRIKNTANKVYPLVMAKWTENDCLNWCKDNDLLSPIYKNHKRGGVGFV